MRIFAQINVEDFDPEYNSSFDMDLLLHMRKILNKELEKLREEGKIGASEDTRVRFFMPFDLLTKVYPLGLSQLRDVFKVSMIDFVEAAEFSFEIEVMKDSAWGFCKCKRCYLWHASNDNPEQVCDKCLKSLAEGWPEIYQQLIGKQNV